MFGGVVDIPFGAMPISKDGHGGFDWDFVINSNKSQTVKLFRYDWLNNSLIPSGLFSDSTAIIPWGGGLTKPPSGKIPTEETPYWTGRLSACLLAIVATI